MAAEEAAAWGVTDVLMVVLVVAFLGRGAFNLLSGVKNVAKPKRD